MTHTHTVGATVVVDVIVVVIDNRQSTINLLVYAIVIDNRQSPYRRHCHRRLLVVDVDNRLAHGQVQEHVGVIVADLVAANENVIAE